MESFFRKEPEEFKRKLRKKAPVSSKSARGSGRSRDPIISAATGTPAIDRELAVAEVCGAYVGQTKVTFIKRKRKKRTKLGPAGSTYNGMIVDGEKCGALAILTRYVDGKRVHRCARHAGDEGLF
jgi:hypothetical protein